MQIFMQFGVSSSKLKNGGRYLYVYVLVSRHVPTPSNIF